MVCHPNKIILSHQHNFIFIKTRKTAGTSIEIALSKYCGDKDIITPISKPDEELRSHLGFRGPQNYLDSWTNYSFKDWCLLFTKRNRKKKFFNHMSASLVKDLINKEVWNSYFKFCFERNPWEKVISYYFWYYRSKPGPPLSQLISEQKFYLPSDFKLYTIDGKVAVDYIGRYENLETNLDFIRKKLNLPEKLHLPRAKSQFRKDQRHYSEILASEQIQVIADVFFNEIQRNNGPVQRFIGFPCYDV